MSCQLLILKLKEDTLRKSEGDEVNELRL